MALRLRVVSDHRRSLGDRCNIVFGVGGGTIGRSADNDWVLPDPLRYVSAHHARISFRQGAYFLEDVSTNGVYINDSEKPLGRSAPHKLLNGDLLRFGDYQVNVVLENDHPAEPAAALSGPVPVPTSIHALRTVGRAAQTDIGAALDLDALLVPDASAVPEPARDVASSGGFRPVNAYGQAVARAPRPATTPAPAAEVSPAPELDPDEPPEEVIARRIARLAKAAGRDPRNGASAPAIYDVQSGLQAFCRGAGIDMDKLPGDAQTRLMHLVGQLVREAFVGLKDLERSRNEIRNRFRIEMTTDPDDPRPSLARMGVEELLLALLHQHETRRVDAVQWLRESMSTAKDHENATVHAMRDAFVEFVGRLDPAELEARFERAARRGKVRTGTVKHWELYGEFYKNLVEKPAELLPHTFVEAFSLAYREFMQKPKD